MIDIISKASKDPLGTMMLDYLHGQRNVFVEVDSPTLEMWTMPGKAMFRDDSGMDELEKAALHLCEGKILDVGAGSGCHSLYLQRQGFTVDALDISPGCVQVMKNRQVKNVFHQNFFSMQRRKYNTILILMNGMGICGTLWGCNIFLQFVKTILEEGGQVIADSTDLRSIYDVPDQFDYANDGYYGETEFVIRYNNIKTDPFNWIYLDFNTLEALSRFNGLQCTKILSGNNGKYLVRLW